MIGPALVGADQEIIRLNFKMVKAVPCYSEMEDSNVK